MTDFTGYTALRGLLAGDNRPKPKYFVLMASMPDDSCDPGVIAVGAKATLEAFEHAKTEYRKVSGLKTNVHVHIRKLFQSENKEEALLFYEMLTAKIHEEVDKDDAR